MANANKKPKRKQRVPVNIQMHPSTIRKIDRIRAAHPVHTTRSAVIRALVQVGLATTKGKL